MKQILLFISILTLSYSSQAEEYYLEGYAPDFVGKEVVLYTYQDYITMTKFELGRGTVNAADSLFRIELKNKATIKGVIEIDKTESFMYLAPETGYQVYYPRPVDQPISFRNQETKMIFFGLDSTDINYRILEYNQWFDMFVSYHSASIYSGNFAQYLDTFKVDVVNYYEGVEDEYFLTYVRYNIGEMDQVFGGGSGENRLQTYLNYIAPFPVYYENDQYMSFIKRFYTQDFESYAPDVEASINLALYNASPTQLMQALKKDIFLAREDIREMIMIDKLGKSFYKRVDIKRNVLIILDSVETNALNPIHSAMAKNVKTYLTSLEYGYPAPHISLKDSVDEEITWGRYEGKFVYFNFFATWNEQAIKEMRIIYELKLKYGEDVAFLSVCIDDNKKTFDQYMSEHPEFDWDIVYIGKDEELMESFQAQSVPSYYLIDQAGFILFAPSAGPSPDGEYESIDKTFWEIHKYLHPVEERRVGQ